MTVVTNTFTDTLTLSYTGNGKAVSSKVATVTGTKDAGVAAVITAGAVNQEIDIAFPFGTIQGIVLDASQNVTIKTNSTTTPGDTISLNANVGIFWVTGQLAAKPLTADVTKLFVSNPGSTDAVFNVRVLYN